MQYLTTGGDQLKTKPDFKLVGRDADLKRLTSTMLRSKASSIILAGPGGVGATALIMGLQASKAEPDAPFDIVSKRIWWLHGNDLFSLGDKVEIEKQFDLVLATLRQTPKDSVLVIEDTRDFLEGLRKTQTEHLINSLNAVVKRGETQVILECRDEELDMVLKTHSDMHECYTLLLLEEPVGDALTAIVDNASATLEEHHGINIDPEARAEAIMLTNKYRTRDASLSRAQPERSVNLLDRAMATYRLESHKHSPQGVALVEKGASWDDVAVVEFEAQFAKTQAQLKQLYQLTRDAEVAITGIEAQIITQQATETEAAKDAPKDAVGSFTNSLSNAGFDSEAVDLLRKAIVPLRKVANDNRTEYNRIMDSINSHLHLNKEFVRAEFSRLSGIPVDKLNQNEKAKLRNLAASLKSEVYGQDEAIDGIVDAIISSRIGKRNSSKPQAAALWMGPSGVGKTYLTQMLAKYYKDDERALLRMDMAEYSEKHSVSKLIGAPPGYDGYDPQGGFLVKGMRYNPSQIVLFDEIEKAYQTIYDILLSILDAGRLSDPLGRAVSFAESVVLITSNIGQQHLLDRSIPVAERNRRALEELLTTPGIRPEFLNRFDGREGIKFFNMLEIDDILRIITRELKSIKGAYETDTMIVSWDPEVLRSFADTVYDPVTGARGPVGIVRTKLEPVLAKLIMAEESDVVKGEFTVAFDPATKLLGFDRK